MIILKVIRNSYIGLTSHKDTKKHLVRLQMAALNTSHRLLRSQVVLNKRLLSAMVLLIRIRVFEVCPNVVVEFITICVVKF